jgi:hypothetical protein
MITAMLLVAVLFVAFALIRPSPGCSHECGDCGGPCQARDDSDDRA